MLHKVKIKKQKLASYSMEYSQMDNAVVMDALWSALRSSNCGEHQGQMLWLCP